MSTPRLHVEGLKGTAEKARYCGRNLIERLRAQSKVLLHVKPVGIDRVQYLIVAADHGHSGVPCPQGEASLATTQSDQWAARFMLATGGNLPKSKNRCQPLRPQENPTMRLLENAADDGVEGAGIAETADRALARGAGRASL